ncbi:MAG: hypothetical protein Q8S33_02145 [Myxococcales bacterium]|nr:hypothetical protein [Myxococcales bacterium]MDP3499098.1 hypothetical protein [Myxococcales bacterium]
MKLPPPHRLKFAVKVAMTVGAEVVLAPSFIVGSLLLRGPANERLLALQNALRQRALVWLFPEVEAKPRR